MSRISRTAVAALIIAVGGLAGVATTAQAAKPKITVDKTASPTSLPEPGGTFTFTVLITNTDNGPGAASAEIVSLVDDVYGDLAGKGSCTTAVGTVLTPTPGPGNTYTCSFEGTFTGKAKDKQTDTVTATVRDPLAPGDTTSAFGKATVELTGPTGPTCGGQGVTIPGTSGPDTLVGTDNSDVIAGFGGDDVISGGLGEDLICGGPGADLARGNAGDDVVKGGGSNDRLRGSSGRDRLSGGSGGDRMKGGSGKDFCSGGSGRDRARSCETVRSVP